MGCVTKKCYFGYCLEQNFYFMETKEKPKLNKLESYRIELNESGVR